MDEEKDVEFEAEQDADMRSGDVHDAVHKLEKLKGEIEKIKKEKQEYLDGWQRSKADYVNLLKRGSTELKAAEDKGIAKAVEELFPAFDALERAKDHGEVPVGFLAIAKQLEGAFAGLGLEPIGTVGEQFNPMLHEALGQDAATSIAEDDKITAILEKGWRIGENVVRPAKVRVAHYSAEA